MQGDLRLNFETLTKRSTQNKVTVGSFDKSVDTQQNKDLVDIQEAPPLDIDVDVDVMPP
tara:strand:- start:140 stop:316 length:177 start_codon:yes stop_codon:yes gene_type:complete